MNDALPADDRTALEEAIELLTRAGRTDDLCGAFVGAVAITGAAISTLGRPLGSQTVCASDAIAARMDEIQIDLGEGPCWTALRTRLPLLEPDFQNHGGSEWPAARDALRSLDIGALYAFPLFVGDLSIGSVDLYSRGSGTLSARAVADAQSLAEVTSRTVLRRALNDADDVENGMEGGRFSRREVHQASGMVAAQLAVTVDDALLVIRAHAYSSGRSVVEISADVVARRLSFSPTDGDSAVS